MGGGGGHTGSNNIVMAFSPRNIVGCLLKTGVQRGGHGHPRTPLATPLGNRDRLKRFTIIRDGSLETLYVYFGTIIKLQN